MFLTEIVVIVKKFFMEDLQLFNEVVYASKVIIFLPKLFRTHSYVAVHSTCVCPFSNIYLKTTLKFRPAISLFYSDVIDILVISSNHCWIKPS